MNAITQAFANAGFPVFKRETFKAGWNAKLSYRTHQALVAEGYTRFTGA